MRPLTVGTSLVAGIFALGCTDEPPTAPAAGRPRFEISDAAHISGTPGFRAWYLVDTGKDTLMAISIFKDQAGAEESTRRAAEWIKKNLAELMPNPPEIRAGKVVVQKVK